MPNDITQRIRFSPATATGLFIALFGILIGRQVTNSIWHTLTFEAALWKEGITWTLAIFLLIIIRRGERLPLSSVGLGTSSWWKSILWGLALTVPCLLVAGFLVHLTGYGHGDASAACEKLPLWLVTLIVIRAGVVEEFFYRGYAIERLQSLGLGRFWSAIIPLIIFSVAHWTGGWANILIAFVLGLILALFYLWRRELAANMIGHGMVDFIGNVLPRLLG